MGQSPNSVHVMYLLFFFSIRACLYVGIFGAMPNIRSDSYKLTHF